MFQYLHWPDEWGREIALQLERIRFQIMLTTDGRQFDELETALFRFQNRGGHVDILLCLHAEEKTIRRVNALKRLSHAGAKVGIIVLNVYQTPPGNLAILDKSRLMTDFVLEDTTDIRELIYQQEKIWRQCLEQSEQLLPNSEDIRIHFQTASSFIVPGGIVKLYWDVAHADHIEILPGIGVVEASGSVEVPVFDDTLFQLKAINQASARIQSIFIKTIPQDPFTLEVEVWDTDSGDYIPLESVHPHQFVFAVFRSDKIRIRWNALPAGELTEMRMGSLPLTGLETIQVFADEQFIFTLQTACETYVYTLKILTATASDELIRTEKLPELPEPMLPAPSNEDQSIKTASWLKRFLKWLSWR